MIDDGASDGGRVIGIARVADPIAIAVRLVGIRDISTVVIWIDDAIAIVVSAFRRTLKRTLTHRQIATVSSDIR